MKALNVLLALLVSVLIALAVFEGGLRLIGKGPPASILEFDAHTGWRKKPDISVTRKGSEYSVKIATNSLGLADDELASVAKPAGALRVVVLGDSFTQGFTVNREDLFVDLLEQRWRAEGRNVDVLNAGTEGWSTDQEVAWLLDNGAKFQPDVVILAAYENDLYWNGQARYIDRGSAKPLFKADGTLESATLADVGPRPWTDRLAITRLLKPFMPNPHVAEHIFTPAGSPRPILKEFASVLVAEPSFFARSIDGTRGALIALKNECAKLGAKTLVVPIPSHSAIDPEFAPKFAKQALGGLPSSAWSADKPVDTFLRLAGEVGLESVDARGALRAAHKKDEPLYFSVDWHLNPAGNRALANLLHAEVDRLAWLPAAHGATQDASAAASAKPMPKWPFVFAGLWIALSALYFGTYPKDRNWMAPLKVGAMLAVVFTIVLGGGKLIALLPPQYSRWFFVAFIVVVLGFVIWKLGARVATILELLRSFTLRGHWYLMPLLVVLLSIGSLLVVAASSPLIAPFIYTLF